MTCSSSAALNKETHISSDCRVLWFQGEEARVQFEVELRQQLARQAAAHSDHLQEVLKVQEQELLQKYERQFNLKFIEERQAFQAEIAGWVARLKGIETAVESKVFGCYELFNEWFVNVLCQILFHSATDFLPNFF